MSFEVERVACFFVVDEESTTLKQAHVMGHNPQSIMNIYEIIRRWHHGGSISGVARSLGLDRKTVRHYVKAAQQQGVTRDQPLPEYKHLQPSLEPLVASRERSKPASSQLEPYRQEVLDLINDPKEPMSLMSAWKVLCQRHPHITASYSALKRAVANWQPKRSARASWRQQWPPGQRAQVDYSKVGTLYDPNTERNRTVYAFVGTLAYSRHKYVEFVFAQDQCSFVASHVSMFNFWGGVPQTIVPDCTKTAVLKPGLYDPELNPLYREMAEHFGCFIDPARPAAPKDKGMVERDMRPVKELFRRIKALTPNLKLNEANRQAKQWCRQYYGMTKHGTTREKPYERFARDEYPTLLPLPHAEFELATWAPVNVHPDGYVQFEKSCYSVPWNCREPRLWLRAYGKQVELYNGSFQLVKTHPRCLKEGGRRHDPQDFPESTRAMMNNYNVKAQLRAAERIGPETRALIKQVLQPHAMRNLRCAMGILKHAEQHPAEHVEAISRRARTRGVRQPKHFRKMLAEDSQTELPITVSRRTRQLVRSGDYFVQNADEQKDA